METLEIIEKNILKNISINQLDNNFTLINTIIADTADIKEKNWVIINAKEYDVSGKIIKKEKMLFKSNFDYLKVNNLFSNLSSLNLLQLKNQYNDFKKDVDEFIKDINLEYKSIKKEIKDLF